MKPFRAWLHKTPKNNKKLDNCVQKCKDTGEQAVIIPQKGCFCGNDYRGR